MMTPKRSWIVVLVVVSVTAFFGQRQFGTHEAPEGQPALVHLDAGSIETLRADFNGARDSVRLIVLLSPT
jgi:hypothetical protein